MAIMIASTKLAFFRRYDFDVDPHATLHTEFCRLAVSRGWKQGSNSKIFEKAWAQCFGRGVPVGHNVDDKKKNHVVPQNGTHVDYDISSTLRGLQSLSLEDGNPKKKLRAKEVGPVFTSFYGTNDSSTEKWQLLCQDCGINPAPQSVTQCKKVPQPLPAIALDLNGALVFNPC